MTATTKRLNGQTTPESNRPAHDTGTSEITLQELCDHYRDAYISALETLDKAIKQNGKIQRQNGELITLLLQAHAKRSTSSLDAYLSDASNLSNLKIN